MISPSIKSARESIGTLLGRGLAGAADLIYPPVCLGCGLLVGTHGGLCGDCWCKLRLIERPFCDRLGTPLPYGVGNGAVSPEAMADPPPFAHARAAVLYTDLARGLVHRLKYNDRTDLALTFARWMQRAGADVIEQSDRIVSVPLHRWRLVTRRYNQAAELARALSRVTGMPYLPDALLRTRPTRSQVGLGAAARQDNVRGAFAVPDSATGSLAGAHLLLIDDVYTTGATVKAATRTLMRAGASSVSVLTFARVAPDDKTTLYDGSNEPIAV